MNVSAKSALNSGDPKPQTPPSEDAESRQKNKRPARSSAASTGAQASETKTSGTGATTAEASAGAAEQPASPPDQTPAEVSKSLEQLEKEHAVEMAKVRHKTELAVEESKAAIVRETEKLKAEIELKKQEVKKTDLETEMLAHQNALKEQELQQKALETEMLAQDNALKEQELRREALQRDASARQNAGQGPASGSGTPAIPPDPLAKIDTIQGKLKLEVRKYRRYAWSYIGFSVVYLGLATGAFFLFGNQFQCPYAAILLFLASTAVWAVATAGTFFLMKAVSGRNRENAEHYDKLLHILNERRLRLLDKES